MIRAAGTDDNRVVHTCLAWAEVLDRSVAACDAGAGAPRRCAVAGMATHAAARYTVPADEATIADAGADNSQIVLVAVDAERVGVHLAATDAPGGNVRTDAPVA